MALFGYIFLRNPMKIKNKYYVRKEPDAVTYM